MSQLGIVHMKSTEEQEQDPSAETVQYSGSENGGFSVKTSKKAVKLKQKLNRQHALEAVDSHRKLCDVCHEPKDILIRCKVDAEGAWKMLCTQGCWQKASNSQIDGTSATPNYVYGGV